ncbi:MAG: isoprenylcysteine carboxylmethyltransferase family protein [Hyphomicrobiaceae bacterium]|nr:isoprenylcysteine carboxylmethyltransferase family protein [Hyphomicrobiaceae bacterium]
MEVFERVFVLAIFIHFLMKMLGRSAAEGIEAAVVLLVLAEIIPVVMVFARGPSSTLSQKPSDWLFGMAGATMPLLAIAPHVTPLAPAVLCITLMMLGLALQVAAKFFLGRSFGIVAANRGVKVNGPYRFVRHPMYAGYTLTHIGFLLMVPHWQNFVVYAAALTLQVIRILREERVLSQDPSYQEFAATVRYRLLPGVF